MRISELMFHVTNLLPDDSSTILLGLLNPVIVKFVNVLLLKSVRA